MFRFVPWQFIVRRAARAYGFADPALWLARIRNFAQPSEVQEPIELVRAGVLFHARGIVNARAIQHNLDWVWPYWVERQFDPEDISFIPRAFSLSHINLTHRNWTAIGTPDLPIYSIVDPRGLVTPLFDGWSIDFWLFDGAGSAVIPSRLQDGAVRQELDLDRRHTLVTELRSGQLVLRQSASMTMRDGQPLLQIQARATSPGGGKLVMALRPYNPEGVQFIDNVTLLQNGHAWRVNGQTDVQLDRPPDEILVSNYRHGDVYLLVDGAAESTRENGAERHAPVADGSNVQCDVGMATAASVYHFDAEQVDLTVHVPLARELAALGERSQENVSVEWAQVARRSTKLRVPDPRFQFLFDSAVHSLVLLSAGEIVPGPYTYRRFWFRDACLMINALLAIGFHERCERAIEGFFEKQLHNGYFRSQEGEWDSNGQVLWILERFTSCTNTRLRDHWITPTVKAVEWLDRKRVRASDNARHAGLLPAGFSAEHLGPNDHYYWDDYWAVAGLSAAHRLFADVGRRDESQYARQIEHEMRDAIERSIARIPIRRSGGGIPASPYRRMDAGAIGSLVADYPLQLYQPGERRIMATVNALLARNFHKGGFFQDIIHSGINAYLTLDVAQTLLRAGDARYQALVERVAELATSTGQWPEAIHPQTLGGCMGDGQHGWAAAEWVMMTRSLFVREEERRLILGSGLFDQWFDSDDELLFGPTATPYGELTMRIENPRSEPVVYVEAGWRQPPPSVDIRVPGFEPVEGADLQTGVRLVPLGERTTNHATQRDRALDRR